MLMYYPVKEATGPSYVTWLENNIQRFQSVSAHEGGSDLFKAATTDRQIGLQLSIGFLKVLKGEPLSNKEETVSYLKKYIEVLNGQIENDTINVVFNSPEGDVATAKDLVGNFLATLTDATVTIQ